MATMDPKFKSAVYEVIAKHTAPTHVMSGGKGVCCFVWVTGPAVTPKGNPSTKRVKACFSSNCLDLSGTFYDDMKDIPGYVGHYVNLD
jgi:hypothetical protein